MVPKLIKTEKDVDEVAKFLKESLKKAKEAGQEGIEIVHQFTPNTTTYRSELRFTFEHKGIKFSGCIYEPEMISNVLAAMLATAKAD